MTTGTQKANVFDLSCDSTQVMYATTSISGEPLLTYLGPEGDRNLSGSQIETLTTAPGTEVTVTLQTIPDLRTLTLTVLIPSFRLPESKRAEFDTLAIKTTNHTSIAGPPEGPGQTYEAVSLHGVARVEIS